MKKLNLFIAIFIALVSISNLCYSQCVFVGGNNSNCTPGNLSFPDCKIHNPNIENPYPPHDRLTLKAGSHCGISSGTGGTGNIELYSLDLRHNITSANDSLISNGLVTDINLIYILYKFQEYNLNAPGKLSSLNEEGAAVQLAIHHFDEGLDLNTMDTVAPGAAAKKRIHTRAWFIVNNTIANAPSFNYNIITPIQFIDLGNNQFQVKIRDQDGLGQSGRTVNLCCSNPSVTLSPNSPTTNANGLTPVITISGPITNGDKIGAKCFTRLPTGLIFINQSSDPNLCQKFVGTVAPENPNDFVGDYCDEITWGVLPVELSSFTAGISGRDVTLNWSTREELNNEGFELYRTLIGTYRFEKIGFINGNGTSNQVHDYSFTDRNLNSGRYTYRIKQIDFNGNFKFYPLGTEIGIGVPQAFNMSQNYPNPFNPSTKIDFDLPVDGNASIKVFDNSGKEVAELINEFTTAGYHSVTFNSNNLASGVYYYRLNADGFTKTMKMALIK